MNLNIVGEIRRLDPHYGLNKYQQTAEYAELGPNNLIQMFYKQGPIDSYLPDSKIIWHYLSYCNLWQGSSDDMSKKRLLKLID